MFELKDLTLITCSAEGENSGATESTSVFMPNEMFYEYQEEIQAMEVYFPELDGEYCDVKGDIWIVASEKGKILHLTEMDDDQRMRENLESIIGTANSQIIHTLNVEIADAKIVQTITRVWYNGKEYTV